MTGPIPLPEAAVAFTQRGWHVFPLWAGTKGQNADGTPAQYLANGYKDASNDTGIVQDWWRRWPDANIGLSLAASGLVAIDIDSYKTECAWEVASTDRDVPATFTQVSARGGRHLLFRAPSERRFAGKLCAGVDIKRNGYILLAPSTFGGRPYRIIDDRQPALAPDWLPSNTSRPTSSANSAGPKPKAASPAEVREFLDWVDPDCGYGDWIEVLQALHENFDGGEAGLALAEEWSQKGVKFVPGEVAQKWRGFRAGSGVTIATLAHHARQGGADLAAIARRHGKMSAALPPSSASALVPSPDADSLDLSQDALALALGRHAFDDDARYVASQELWYLWNGTVWQADDRLRVMTLARDFLREVAARAGKRADDPAGAATRRKLDHLRSHATVSAVATLARANPASAARASDFDRDILLLGTPTGTVDLRDGRLRPPRREQMITRQTTVGPAQVGAVPKRWLAFLHEIMNGDADLVAFLQRAAGYGLTGSTNEHKLLFLHGSGRNGKSVFLNTLLNIWGSYGRRVPAAAFLSGKVERHPTDLASLRGARLAVASELARGKSWDEAVLKDLTGGDRMAARFMRQNFFEFDPQLTLMIAGNIQPSFRGVDVAIRSRVVLVPFTVTIPPDRQDRGLEAKLRAEGPEILRWCIEGALAWQQGGLRVPASLVRASEEYFDDEDIVGQFLRSETRDDPDGFASNVELGVRFNAWAGFQNLDPWTQRSVVKELKARGYSDARRSAARGLSGLRLK